ncbi:MAG TPA: phosphatidylglycerophosphatase A [Verrucomicrobiae bacterium]|nr:phosphatidylglycerophosphatase A [Verrucomicrobiae bacterium]
MRTLALWIAQGFGIGRIPVAPGTFGSALGLLWFALLLATGNLWLYLLGTLLGFGISVWLCGIAEKILQKKDPSSVVLDEIAAIPVCFVGWVAKWWMAHQSLPAINSLFTQKTWYWTLLIFVLFRIFDIAKPWPIRGSQALRGGWGVTIDDLLAAIYVFVLSFVFLWLF